MGTLNLKPLNIMLNAATQTICKAVWPQGFDTTPEPLPFESERQAYEDLCREYACRKRITVWTGCCDKTIFDDPDINVMFRAWHDWCHIMGGHDFSLEGERQAALMQCEHIKRRYGDGDTGRDLCHLIMIEVLGQAQYAEAHGGNFPVDQMQFTKAYLALGATALTASF